MGVLFSQSGQVGLRAFTALLFLSQDRGQPLGLRLGPLQFFFDVGLGRQQGQHVVVVGRQPVDDGLALGDLAVFAQALLLVLGKLGVDLGQLPAITDSRACGKASKQKTNWLQTALINDLIK